MDNDQVKTLMARVAELWPKMDLTGPQGEVWAARMKRLPFDHAKAAVDVVFAKSKYTPKPGEVESLALAMAASAQARLHGEVGGAEREPETWVQQIRRMHRVPADVSDGDVLVWWHIENTRRGRAVYGKGFDRMETVRRGEFRRDWAAAGLAPGAGHEAECRVFGGSVECDAFWHNRREAA